MSDEAIKFIWRCAKCSYHIVNISQSDGVIKQEKKCPKCKSLNILTLSNKDIYLHCKTFDSQNNCYIEDQDDRYPYHL